MLLSTWIYLLVAVFFCEQTRAMESPPETMSRNNTAPGSVPLDAQNYPVAPEGLNLQQVYLFVRHGERTPVGARMTNPPASIPQHWMFCHEGRDFMAAVASHTGQDTLRVKRVVEREDGSVHDGQCFFGELTDVGRRSTRNFGNALRKIYVERLGFLPDTVHDDATVYLRSTNLPRTVESLQQITYGLYPSSKQGRNFTSNVRIRNPKDETLFGNAGACERLKVLMGGFAKAAAVAYNPLLASLDEKLSKFIDGNPIRVDGSPRASGILDTVRAAEAHGVSIPAELRDKDSINLIEQAVVSEWFSDRNEEVRRLGFGRLLNEITQKMHKKVKKRDEDPVKILIHSTHDTALAGLSSTLGVFDEKWPPFTAAATFELFKGPPESPKDRSYLQTFLSTLTSSEMTQRHYVRMRYQNRDMIMPACQNAGDHLEGHPEFCTLEAFSQRVKELTPVNWETECV